MPQNQQKTKLAVIGGGSAGMAAALAAHEAGIPAGQIMILERGDALGGILQQCIHTGFGLHIFKQELSGPEYAQRYIDKVLASGIEYRLNSPVLSITADRHVFCISPGEGVTEILAEAIILATGCRERTRGAIGIAGTRPAGVFTAGTAQKLINCEGYMAGRRAVILGSGDIGLIMARRLTLEGAQVEGVYELMPYSNGLVRNIAQCLDDYGIPLHLSTTVIRIHGQRRLEGVTVAEVGPDRRPLEGTERYIECDMLLLSVGLIPETELTSEAGFPIDPATSGAYVDQQNLIYGNRNGVFTPSAGVYSCGNVLHVHDLVDFVTMQSEHTGRRAAANLVNPRPGAPDIVRTAAGEGVSYVCPQLIDRSELGAPFRMYFRVREPSRGKSVALYADGERLYSARKIRLIPSEMEYIDVGGKILEKLDGGGWSRLRVTVE